MTTGAEILQRAGILLQDEAFVRWTLPELAGWVDQACLAIILAKPSACSSSRVLTLVAGTLQTIPTEADEPKPLALLSITRNVSAAGPPRVGGRTIRATSQAMLDAQDPHWHDPQRTRYAKEVRHYVYDEQNPLEFYVYPGNTGAGLVEAILSQVPTPLAATGDPTLITSWGGTVGLPEPYSGPILDYVLHRAFSKDDLAGNAGRAGQHYAQFASAIGLKIQVEGASSPNARRAG